MIEQNQSQKGIKWGVPGIPGWESLVSVLVYEGMRLLLPELKEWLRLGATAIALKRQEIRARLIEFAREKELDFPQAEKAADTVSKSVDIKRIIEALQKK